MYQSIMHDPIKNSIDDASRCTVTNVLIRQVFFYDIWTAITGFASLLPSHGIAKRSIEAFVGLVQEPFSFFREKERRDRPFGKIQIITFASRAHASTSPNPKQPYLAVMNLIKYFRGRMCPFGRDYLAVLSRAETRQFTFLISVMN